MTVNNDKVRLKIASKRNDVWINSHMRAVMEVWGANMDWQLIIDPGMVLDYMAKYVTKSDNAQTKGSHRMIRNLFTKTVQEEGRSTQAFLRRVMSKFMGERVMSKQESCHLLLGLPIVFL